MLTRKEIERAWSSEDILDFYGGILEYEAFFICDENRKVKVISYSARISHVPDSDVPVEELVQIKITTHIQSSMDGVRALNRSLYKSNVRL